MLKLLTVTDTKTAKNHKKVILHTHTHSFNGPFSGTTRVSQYQKGKTSLDFTEAKDSEWQWHQLGHMQVCTSLQTYNHTNTLPLSFTALSAAQPTVSKHWRHKKWYYKLPNCSIWSIAINIMDKLQFLIFELAVLLETFMYCVMCLQYFDAVGWAAGRASSL